MSIADSMLSCKSLQFIMYKKFCSLSIKSNSLLSCLSVSTMCLLVFTSIIIITIISITPIIILGLGQINAGQRDVLITPTSGFLNSSKISKLSQQTVMPRLSTRTIVNGQGGSAWFMDLELEKSQHLGTLKLNNEVQLNNSVYLHSQYGIKEGEKVDIQMMGSDILTAIQEFVRQSTDDGQTNSDMSYLMGQFLHGEFIVAGVFEQALGKFAVGSVGGYVYFDIKSAFVNFVNATLISKGRSNSRLVDFLQNEDLFKLGDFAKEICINIPDRVKIYSSSDYQVTYDTLSRFGSNILSKIGMFSVNSEIPIADSLVQMSYFGMFIGVILKLIITSLFILSAIMMNNMMLMGTDRKSFDFALLKTMGANRVFVVISLLLSSFKYVLISNLVAFPFASVTLGYISSLFQMFFGYSYEVSPTLGAILGGMFIGVLVPIISSISPIWSILKNDLVENLNPIRNKTQAIHTEIYIEGGEFPLGKLIFGLISSIFGLMIYYLLPKGLINQDIGLLLFVFFAILMGLLIGLILLSYSVQYLLEKLIAYLTLFWVNKTDFILTLKNMSAHRFKNRRSSILYSLSVAFIIFVSVGISIQMQTISEEMLKKHGTYIEIQSGLGTINRNFYNQIFKDDFKDYVQDWAYQTSQFSSQIQMNQNVMKVQFSDKARIFFTEMRLYGVSPNFGKVLPSYRLPIVKTYATEPYDPYEYLYTPKGYMTCTMSQFAAWKFNLVNSNDRQFLLKVSSTSKSAKIKLLMSTVFSQRMGLSYSRFDFIRHEVGVSFETYANLTGLSSYTELPIAKIKVKVKDPTKTKQLANKLRMKMATRNIDSVWDFSELEQTINKIDSLLRNILNILLILVLLISFFSLVTTSYINIVNQSTQIGILMTLGYDKNRIVRIFIYESFVLVLNSCLIGVAVGTFVAWMMGLQRQLFGDFPVTISIDGIWIIGLAAIVSSILSIIKPISQLFSKSINQIFLYS